MVSWDVVESNQEVQFAVYSASQHHYHFSCLGSPREELGPGSQTSHSPRHGCIVNSKMLQNLPYVSKLNIVRELDRDQVGKRKERMLC